MLDIERTKFALAPHPLEREGGKRKLEPTQEWKNNAVKARRAILERANGPVFKKVLQETEAAELVERIGSELDEEYIHGAHPWRSLSHSSRFQRLDRWTRTEIRLCEIWGKFNERWSGKAPFER